MQRYNPTDEEIQNVHDYLTAECPGTVGFTQWAGERRAQVFTVLHNGMRHQVVIALAFFDDCAKRNLTCSDALRHLRLSNTMRQVMGRPSRIIVSYPEREITVMPLEG